MTYSEKVVEAMNHADLSVMEENVNLALKHDSDEYLLALQDVLMQAGYIELAKKVIENLLEKNPKHYDLYIPLAEIAIEDNDIEKAFELLDSIPQDSDTYVQALIVLADLYQMLGVPEVSEQKLLEAKKQANDPIIDFALAELYYSNGDFEKAKSLYTQLLEQGQEQLAGISLEERIADILVNLGQFEESVPLLEKLTEQHSDQSQLQFLLALSYYNTDQDEKAMGIFKQLLEDNPELSAVYYYLAELLLKDNQLDATLQTAEQGLKYEPMNIGLYTLVAEVAYRQHDVKTAEEYLKQALEIEDFNGGDQARLALATMYVNEERGEEAIELLKDSNEMDGYAHWLMAQAYRQEEEYEEAMKHYEEARHDMDHDLAFMKDYGLMLREEGRTQEAVRWLSHYLEHEPTDMEVADLLAEEGE